MKSQCLHHDKFRDLHKLIGAQSTAHTAGYLEVLWAHASQVKCGPIFERHRIEKVADWIGEEGVLLNALIQVRFFDVLEDDRVAIHDWFEHCPEFVKKRDYQKFHMRDKRKKLDAVSPNISHVSAMLDTVSPPTNTNLTNTNHINTPNGVLANESPSHSNTQPSKPKKEPKLKTAPKQKLDWQDENTNHGFWEFWSACPEQNKNFPGRCGKLWMEQMSETPDPGDLKVLILNWVAKMKESEQYRKGMIYAPYTILNERLYLKPIEAKVHAKTGLPVQEHFESGFVRPDKIEGIE